MRKRWWLFLVAPPAIVLLVWLFGEIVMRLWNSLLPGLFGWHAITFWQALGLMILCRLLFGGFGNHGPRGSNWRRRRTEHWQAMTPEEREKFRQRMRERCGGFSPPDSGTNEPA